MPVALSVSLYSLLASTFRYSLANTRLVYYSFYSHSTLPRLGKLEAHENRTVLRGSVFEHCLSSRTPFVSLKA